MTKFQPMLDSVIFEIRYASGHLYFDRCGQTILDLERECRGWLAVQVDTNTGTLEKPDKWYRVSFNNKTYNFTGEKAYKNETKSLSKECSKIWRIIQANLGIEEIIRVGCRIHYLLPTESLEESEKLLAGSKLNINYPERIKDSGYHIKNRQMVTTLIKDQLEYRVLLAGVTRTEGIPPPDIIRQDPKTLSKNQKQFRLSRLEQLSEYSANPKYGVFLDVDCAQYEPKAVSPEAYISDHIKIVSTDFLPILEMLND